MQASVYLDYQASAPLDPRVLEAMLPWLRGVQGNPHSAEHAFGWRAREAISAAQEGIAACIGAEAPELIFTSGATEANNTVLHSFASPREGRDTIVVSAIEHPSVLEAARHCASNGMRIQTCPVDASGAVVFDELRKLLSVRVALVSCGLVNNEIGVVQDVARISSYARRVGALLHSDCSQAPLALQVDVAQIGVDFATFSSHKIHGPSGVGALYVSAAAAEHITPLLLGGGQQSGYRAGTLPTSLCAGFAEAFRLLRIGGEIERSRTRGLRDQLLTTLTTRIPRIRVVGSMNARHPGNLSLVLPVQDARDVVQQVQPQLAIATGSACHSGVERASHVLRAIGLSEQQARRVVRIGVGRFSTEEDIEQAALLISEAIDSIRPVAGEALSMAL